MPKNILLKKEIAQLKGELVAAHNRIAYLEDRIESQSSLPSQSHVDNDQSGPQSGPDTTHDSDSGVEVEVVLATNCTDLLNEKDKTIHELTKKTEDLELKINKTKQTSKWWFF